MSRNTTTVAIKTARQSRLVGVSTNHHGLVDKTRKGVHPEPAAAQSLSTIAPYHPRQARERAKSRGQNEPREEDQVIILSLRKHTSSFVLIGSPIGHRQCTLAKPFFN